jgi:Fe-S cluster biogenesis protein NfuA
MPIRRRILTLLCAAIVALVVAVVPASAGGGNNVVIVDNTVGGQTLVSASTQVVPVPMDTITSGNVAIAMNTDCVGCHSTAVAVQILIVVGFPSNYGPGNAAVAANGGCDSCGAFAYARQHAIQTFGPPVLGGAARARIDELRQQISTTAASILPSDSLTDPCVPLPNLPPPACPMRDDILKQRLDVLVDELEQVVTDALHASGATTTTLFDRSEESGPTS